MEYRYTRFTPRVVVDELRAIRGGLQVGALLPRFALPATDGRTFDTTTIAGKTPLVITFASVT